MKIMVLASAMVLVFFFACAQPKGNGSYVPPKDNVGSGRDEGDTVCAQPTGNYSKQVAGVKGAKAIFYSGEGPTVMVKDSSSTEPGSPKPPPGIEEPSGPDGGIARVPPDVEEPEEPYVPRVVEEPEEPYVPPDVEEPEEPYVPRVVEEPKEPYVPRVAGDTGDYMGISYWINLVDSSGNIQRVTPIRIFRSGERIKLHIEANHDGYLYVMNIGSTGRSHTLFPHAGVSSNFVKAWTPYEIPYGTYMRFDENPGEELLLVMLSPDPITEIPSINRPLNNQETQSVLQVAQAEGAKDIVLENDTGVQPGSYVVAPISSLETKMVALKIKLCHQ